MRGISSITMNYTDVVNIKHSPKPVQVNEVR